MPRTLLEQLQIVELRLILVFDRKKDLVLIDIVAGSEFCRFRNLNTYQQVPPIQVHPPHSNVLALQLE